MTTRLSRFGLLALVVTASLATRDSHAYVRETTSGGRGLYWPSSTFPIAFTLDNTPSSPGGTDNRTAVIQEFQVWQAAACAQFSVTTTPSGIAHSSARATSDNKSVIYWSDTWSYGSGVLGVTTPWFDNSSGVISEADMEFNAHDWTWETPSQYSGCVSSGSNGCVDTASIALHEEGHFLGLDHSSSRAAVMYASWDGTAKRALSSDDVSGICAIYPRNAQGTGVQGAGCVQSTDCISSLICGTPSSGGASVCTRSCTGTSDTSCPSGDSCQGKTGGGYGCFVTTTTNPGTASEGQPCSQTTACASGLVCASTGSDYTCHRTCNPAGTNTCPTGQACASFGDGTGGCFDNSQSGGTAGLGQSCGSQACQTGLICVGSSAADATCRQECGTGIGTCPSGQTCEPLSGANSGACFPGSSTTTVNECGSCTSSTTTCASGLTCVSISNTSKICRKQCLADNACGTGTQCIPSNTSGASEVCSCGGDTGSVATGQRCVADDFCKTGLICVDDGSSDGPVCRGACNSDADCSGGLVCKAFGSESACVSTDATTPDAGRGGTDAGSGSDGGDATVRSDGCTCSSANPMEFGLAMLGLAFFATRRRRTTL